MWRVWWFAVVVVVAMEVECAGVVVEVVLVGETMLVEGVVVGGCGCRRVWLWEGVGGGSPMRCMFLKAPHAVMCS